MGPTDDPRVAEHDVEASVQMDGGVDEGPNLFLVGDIAVDVGASVGTNGRGEFSPFVVLHVCDDDSKRAVFGKVACCYCTDAGSGAGDDGHLAIELLECCGPCHFVQYALLASDVNKRALDLKLHLYASHLFETS